MSSLADLPELVGFFSYSREDDTDSHGALSALRTRIQGELRGQLGRTAKSFHLWQDKEAIPSGTLWETEIKNAVGQSVFFIPIITPTVVASPHCRFELESFLAREAELGRDDLVFPILYIDVPALEEAARRQNDPVLSLIAKRQYVDWREFRYLDVSSTDVRKAVGRFCTHIRDAMQRPGFSPQERKQQEQAAAQESAAAERRRQEAEIKRRAEEEARQESAMEAQRARDAEVNRREEEEVQRQREEPEAKHRAEVDERRQSRPSQARALWPPSRLAVVAACLIGVVALGGVALWHAYTRVCCALGPFASALSPTQERALKPGETFQECTNCPVMMVVPAGSFTMGSPVNEPGRYDDEGPQHTVTFAQQFAVGQHELTFDEWDACVAEGGCDGYKPSDQGWGRGRRPVMNVSWDDANAYVTWLATKTGKSYRLLSESEYEYAMRAGTTTAYPWGDAVGKNNADCKGCGSQWDGKETAPVGSFAANGFGLYDMVGNLWEWTEDCYHDSYRGAPTDGSAWTAGDCSGRVLRGGSWNDDPQNLRSASRVRNSADFRYDDIGYRVARTLLTP